MSAPLPSVYGCYALSRQIPRQGEVELFLARLSDNPSQPLALKRLPPRFAADAQRREAFLAAARRAGLVTHANLTRPLDQGLAAPADSAGESQAPPQPSLFLTREWVPGKNLAQFLERAASQGRRPPVALVIYIFLSAAAALDGALREKGPEGEPLGLAHGHLCLENLLISYDGRVKVSDLAIAASLEGRRPLAGDDTRALGGMLWQALSGGRPPEGDQAPQLSDLNPEADPALEEICRRALAGEGGSGGAYGQAGRLLKDLSALDGRERAGELAGFMAELFAEDLAREAEEASRDLQALAALANGNGKTRACAGILSGDELAMLVGPTPPEPLWRRVLRPLGAAAVAALVFAVYWYWTAEPPPPPPLPPLAAKAQEALKSGGYERALSLLDEAQAQDPQPAPRLARLRAEALMSRAAAKVEDDPGAALEDLKAAIALAPDWAQAHFQAGRLLTKLERWDEALEAYRRALNLDPRLDGAWFNAGYILLRENQCRAAMADFKKVVELDSPHAADAHVNLAVCWNKLGQKDQAVEELKLALLKNPNHQLAQDYLAKLRPRDQE
ncbi:hypothetical protein AAU61_02245 [Desulfocarbo indianensis]|nr:hypothetical protein AAU61_02245 [Desulfocarbo indianensis]